MKYYLHQVAGRLRIKIPSLKRNIRGAREIQDLLKRVSGVAAVSVNTVTGSVVVQFDEERVSSSAILSCLSHEGYIDLAGVVSQQQYVESALVQIGQTASKALLGIALDRALQGTPFAVVTAFI